MSQDNFDWTLAHEGEPPEDPAANPPSPDEKQSPEDDQQSSADAEPSLDELIADFPEEQKETAKKAAQLAQRKMQGRWGQRIREYKEREKLYQQQLEYVRSQQAQTTSPAQQAQSAPDADEQVVREQLEKLYPGLKNLDQYQSVAQNMALQQAELSMQHYIANGPEKEYGKYFAPYRGIVEQTLRANNYQITPQVSKLFETLKGNIQRDIKVAKAESQNRARVGIDALTSAPSKLSDDVVKLTKGGAFDWKSTYAEIARRNK